MVTETIDKKNLFALFKTLAAGKIEKEFVLKSLNIGESTFYRHLNLIKKAGFKIKKIGNAYELIKHQGIYDFEQQELNAFVYLLLFAYSMLPLKKTKHFLSAVEKMLIVANKQNVFEIEKKYETYKISTIAERYSEKIAELNKYLNTKKQITIILKSSKELKIVPIEYNWKKDKLYLKYIDENDSISSILLDEIAKIEGEKKLLNLKNSQEIIFELYGRLAKSYLLKENERVVQNFKDKIVIANRTKNKAKLYRRLLRYDVLCKVTFPKAEANEFQKMIEKALANIIKVSDNIEV